MATPLRRKIPRHLLHPSTTTPALPPTFLLPLRANLSTITHTTDPEPLPSAYKPTTPSPPPAPASKHHEAPSQHSTSSPRTKPSKPEPSSTTNDKTKKTPTQSLLHRTLLSPLPLPPTTLHPPLLTLLASQPPHYITAHLHSRPYLLTTGDTLRLPFHMPLAPPGTLLRLNRASTLGSRDYTLRGNPWVDEEWFVCRARVVGVETEPMRVEEKTKRRQRRVKRVRSKMRFTVLRVVEVGVRVPEGGVEVKSEAGGEEGAGKGKGRLRMGKRVADGGKKVRDVERKTKWKRVDLASAELAVEKEGNTIGESVPLDSGKPAAQVADGEHKQLE